jgi:hypothetical protein
MKLKLAIISLAIVTLLLYPFRLPVQANRISSKYLVKKQ